MYVKEIIRRAAKYKKKSYADMAKALGITPQTYANTLSRGNFQAETIEKIADFLECDIIFFDRVTGNAFFSQKQTEKYLSGGQQITPQAAEKEA